MKTRNTYSVKALRVLTAVILTGLLTTQFIFAQSWYNANWRFRSPVTVQNPGSTLLQDFQVKVTLSQGSNFDFIKAQSDGSDIRFTTNDGTTLISYWIEEWTVSSAVIWLKVPSIPASGNATVFLYYGNPSASSLSDGRNTFRFFDDFESWVQTSQAWSDKQDLLTAKADLTCAVYNNKLYAIGGYNNGPSNALSENYEYDPLLNIWQIKASMPTPRWGPVGVEFDGKIYVFGGQLVNGSGSNANEIYDPVNDIWTSAANGNPLSIPRYTASGVVHPDVLYFPEGKDGYRYWMAYTPYPPQSMENPSIVRSNDGISWTDNGLTNPVIPQGASGSWNGLENPDPDFIYVSSIDKWFMVWDGGDVATNSRKIALAYSSDGKTWTQYDGDLVNGNVNPVILSGTDNNGALWETDGTNSKTCTPSLFYNGGVFYLFYAEEASGNNRGSIGVATFTWNNTTNDIQNLVRNSGNPIINLPADATFKAGGGHLDISRHPTTNDYHMYLARELSGSANYELALLTSSDLATWTNQGTVLSRGQAGQWDETHIYRSSPVVNSTGQIVLFDGDIRMYYSAFGPGTTGIGIADITSDGIVQKYTGAGPKPIPAAIAMQGLMGVRHGTKIHLFYRSYHYEYDPLADTYTQRANVPRQLTWSTCASVGSKIYIIGGYSYDAPTDATNVNYEYDPATDTWATRAPMPGYRYGATRENPVINGKIYVTHGHAGSPFFTTNFEYDPETDQWVEKQSALHDRDGVGCGVINNKLYVIGGRRDLVGPYGTFFNEMYDPSLDTWVENDPKEAWATSGSGFVFADISAKFRGDYGLVIRQTANTNTFIGAESVEGYGSIYALDFDWNVTDLGGIGGTRPETEVRMSELPDYYGNFYFYNESATNLQTLRWYTGLGGSLNHLQYGARNAWHKVTMVRSGVNHYVNFDGNSYGPLTGTPYVGGGTGKFRFGVIWSTTEYIDNVRVRQWAGSDPVTTVGSEVAGSSNWTGGGPDTDWNTPGNWDNGVPSSLTDVTIPPVFQCLL